MKKLLLVIFLLAVGQVAHARQHTTTDPPAYIQSASLDRIGAEAHGKQVQGAGVVIRLLSDDNDGSRHQRFILRLQSGQTLLVAHNIDIAPRVENLKAGEIVEFSGEYKWNSKGGLVHWTHHDPAGQHVGGWLKHGGQIFQ